MLRDVAEAIGTTGLIGGQVMDLDLLGRTNGHRPVAHPTARYLEAVAARKTGALITVSVAAGARLGGASAREQRRLEAYGRAVGLAFQIIDDVMDRDGVAAAYGVARARARASALVQRAQRALRPLGARGETLRQLADFVVTRST